MTWCETVYKGCDASISEPLHEHFASVWFIKVLACSNMHVAVPWLVKCAAHGPDKMLGSPFWGVIGNRVQEGDGPVLQAPRWLCCDLR